MSEPTTPIADSNLNVVSIKRHLGTSLFAANLIYQETVDSTNTLAKRLAEQWAPEGTVVLTERQTSGRGRLGRRWLSPGFSNLTFSLLLRPAIDARGVFSLTMLLALATLDAVESLAGLAASIKWPNDLYVANKKLGGILTEFASENKVVRYVVSGLGLNVNWFPEDENGLLYPATSVLAETGRAVSREALLCAILRNCEDGYGKVVGGDLEEFRRKWNKRSLIFQKRVVVGGNRGTVQGIDGDGALILVDAQGRKKRVLNGDVTITEG
jgi:BirA family biotin operon repressor/biotin-[acetyl-CoA-carboxylase] ligase